MPGNDGGRQDDLGLLTHRVTAALQRALSEALGDAGALGPRHRALLSVIDGGGTRAVELARRSGQHKQVVGTLVDELERLRYVRREADPTDRRAKLVAPTAKGMRQREKIDAAMADIDAMIATSLGEQRYRDFREAFRAVADLLADL
jgi:DNA-binding MarR family transcriptional regulator